MARSGIALALTAIVVAGFDLAHKAMAIAGSGGAMLTHERPLAYVAVVSAVAGLWAGAIVLTRSISIALAGGVLAGGAVGNVVSLALWPSVPGVPNPLLAGDFAFNLGDLAVAAGVVLLLVAATLFAARNRERLREPVRLRS
jgi:lipoprotein signal peptidase